MDKGILHENKCNLLRELYPLREDPEGFFEDLAAWCIEQVKVARELWNHTPSMDMFAISQSVNSYRKLLGQTADVAYYMAMSSGVEVPDAVTMVRTSSGLNTTRTIH